MLYLTPTHLNSLKNLNHNVVFFFKNKLVLLNVLILLNPISLHFLKINSNSSNLHNLTTYLIHINQLKKNLNFFFLKKKTYISYNQVHTLKNSLETNKNKFRASLKNIKTVTIFQKISFFQLFNTLNKLLLRQFTPLLHLKYMYFFKKKINKMHKFKSSLMYFTTVINYCCQKTFKNFFWKNTKLIKIVDELKCTRYAYKNTLDQSLLFSSAVLNLTFVLENFIKKKKFSKFFFFNKDSIKTKGSIFYQIKKNFFEDYWCLRRGTKIWMQAYITKKLLEKTKKYEKMLLGNSLFKLNFNLAYFKINILDNNELKCWYTFYKFFYNFYFLFSFKHQTNLTKMHLYLYKNISLIKNNLFFVKTNYFISSQTKKIILRKLTHNTTNSVFFTKFFYYFLANFFERFFKVKIFLKLFLNSTQTSKQNNLIQYLTKKYFSFQINVGKGFFLNEMLYVLFYMFKYKDIFIFKHWLKINLERIFFVKHKKFLYKLKLLLKEIFPTVVKTYKIKGFYLSTSGKISAAGNSRKRRYLISIGFSSFSGYKYKISYTKYTIRTKTGVLGLTTALTYF